MIHLKIDLVPVGHEEGREQISEFYIHNVGRLEGDLCKYKICKKDPRFPANKKQETVEVEHYREDGVDVLIALALRVWIDR